ncbi:MAG TPA: hypothetical protein VK738_21280 [Terriglobales bacterium]|nr:hypothetical protein [Terriglobales bacterium]
MRKLDRDAVQGHVSPASFVTEGKLELLNTSGKQVFIDLEEIKGVYFVREFNDSESLNRKTFAARPRSEGLWVRLRFRDGEVIEGMMPNELTQLSADGFLIIPPDTRSNTQRIFVPKQALESLAVLAVIGGPQARRRKTLPTAEGQVPMFSE